VTREDPAAGPGRGVRHQTLRPQVLEWLREALVSGVLIPGQRVNEVHVAQQLGVSRGTLREALRNLEQDGLLVSVPHRGTFVRKLTAKQVRDVYEVLGMIEGLAARRAAERLTPELSAELTDLLDRFEEVRRDGGASLRDRQDADMAFHERICELADSEALLSTWRGLRGVVMAVVFNAGEETVAPLQDPTAHRHLLDVLQSAPGESIETTFRDHIRRAADVIATSMEQTVDS
jgi:DNA-binding GntR family transcriptional regulator